jgi:hypothetical protein
MSHFPEVWDRQMKSRVTEQPQMKYAAIIWMTSLLSVYAYAAATSRAPISASASLAKNELNVSADGVTLHMKASGCSSFTYEIAVCNGGVQLTITKSSANINQVIRPSAIFISNKYTLYDGPLTDGGKRGAYSFLLSDVNGDGNDDLIVWTGRDGAYGGPSFDVYLLNAAEHKYAYSHAYSDLTVGSAGLFTIENGKLKTIAKDGCCTHIFETYQVESDEPKLVERVTESTSEGSDKISVKTERLIGDRMTVVPVGEDIGKNGAECRAKPSVLKEKCKPSPLEGMLSLLIAKEGAAWSSFANVPGVQWSDRAPVKSAGVRQTESSYHRRGKLLLAGFGVVDMPNGKVGTDFGLVKGNEGNAGVILSGDANQVHSISLMKFYPSENYQQIIRQQLLPEDTIKLIADRCMLDGYGTSENTGKNEFYEVGLAAGFMYAEASIDDEDVSTAGASSLGSTAFDFYRNRPAQRMAAMRCRDL